MGWTEERVDRKENTLYFVLVPVTDEEPLSRFTWSEHTVEVWNFMTGWFSVDEDPTGDVPFV